MPRLHQFAFEHLLGLTRKQLRDRVHPARDVHRVARTGAARRDPSTGPASPPPSANRNRRALDPSGLLVAGADQMPCCSALLAQAASGGAFAFVLRSWSPMGCVASGSRGLAEPLAKNGGRSASSSAISRAAPALVARVRSGALSLSPYSRRRARPGCRACRCVQGLERRPQPRHNVQEGFALEPPAHSSTAATSDLAPSRIAVLETASRPAENRPPHLLMAPPRA